MEAARIFPIFLLFVCWWRTSYASSIKLCTESPTNFVNGTAVPAMLGKPVSVVLCVQCEPCLYISPYIHIKHPNYPSSPDYYYANNLHDWRPIVVNITFSANKATINITIKTVQTEDFTNQFSVIIHTNRGITDNSVFFFNLNDAATSDTSKSDAFLILSTQAKMPAVTSIRTSPDSSSTELLTVSSQASTAFTSTSSPTQEFKQCWPQKTSQCPENWYQIDNETCLLVIGNSNSSTPELECQKYNSQAKGNLMDIRSCLTKILRDWTLAFNHYVVCVNATNYVKKQSGRETTGTRTRNYRVVSTNGTLNFPKVSTFSLQIYNKTREWSLVDNNTDHVTVNTTFAFLRLICEAEGSPQPRVTITDAWHMQIKSGGGFTVAPCRGTEVFTCTANNSLGSSQAHRSIQLLTPITNMVFTLNSKYPRQTIGSGHHVELRCGVEGCPDNVTITRNAHPITVMTYTTTLVHVIKRAKCSHMGTYTCVAKARSGQDVQKTASLEVRGCPVSLCESKDASREMSPILGENITFSLCLMSSALLNSLANETKITVKFTRNPISRVYWTVNITMYNIRVKDYGTHTVRIENRHGGLDIYFTLAGEDRSNSTCEQKPRRNEFESNILLISLPPICFIIIVFIIAGIIWYRVKGTFTARSRDEDKGASGTSCENTKEGHYENPSPKIVSNAEYEEAAGVQYESIILNTDGKGDLPHAENVETDDVQHEMPIKSIDINKLTSHVNSSEAEYANTITHL